MVLCNSSIYHFLHSGSGLIIKILSFFAIIYTGKFTSHRPGVSYSIRQYPLIVESPMRYFFVLTVPPFLSPYSADVFPSFLCIHIHFSLRSRALYVNVGIPPVLLFWDSRMSFHSVQMHRKFQNSCKHDNCFCSCKNVSVQYRLKNSPLPARTDMLHTTVVPDIHPVPSCSRLSHTLYNCYFLKKGAKMEAAGKPPPLCNFYYLNNSPYNNHIHEEYHVNASAKHCFLFLLSILEYTFSVP